MSSITDGLHVSMSLSEQLEVLNGQVRQIAKNDCRILNDAQISIEAKRMTKRATELRLKFLMENRR